MQKIHIFEHNIHYGMLYMQKNNHAKRLSLLPKLRKTLLRKLRKLFYFMLVQRKIK